jgi:hypothetical protein
MVQIGADVFRERSASECGSILHAMSLSLAASLLSGRLAIDSSEPTRSAG